MAPSAAGSLRCRLPTFLGLFQGALLLFFSFFVTYDEQADGTPQAAGAERSTNEILGIFPLFRDVQAMLAVALGLLLAFLPRYGLGALAFTFLLLNVSTQWALLLRGLLYHRGSGGRVRLGLRNLLEAEFAATTVLISAGAVLGSTSPLQLLLAALCEVPVYLASEWAIVTGLGALDVGGTITIHVFACYFGLAMSWALLRGRGEREVAAAAPTRQSDTLSLVGMLALWVLWPSFVAAPCAPGAAQHRAALHTVLALGAGALTATLASAARRGGRLRAAHLQNASLAGGVAVGIVADMRVTPGAALALGSAAALACVLGAERLAPALTRRLGLLDQCGIHSLHGLPGIVGAAASVVAILATSEDSYGQRFHEEFLVAAGNSSSAAGSGMRRSGAEQALAQAAALPVALGCALLGGALTGALLHLPALGAPPATHCADDSIYFDPHGTNGGDGTVAEHWDDGEAGVALKEV